MEAWNAWGEAVEEDKRKVWHQFREVDGTIRGMFQKQNQLYEMATANHAQAELALQMASSLAEDQAVKIGR